MIELMPLEPFGGTIKMMYYGNFFDRNKVIIENTVSKDINTILDPQNKVYIDDLYKVPCINIPRVKTGRYNISALSNNGRSESVCVDAIDDNNIDRISAIKDMINLDSDICDNIIRDMEDDKGKAGHAIRYIFAEYIRNMPKLKKQKEIYQLLSAVIEMQNRYIKSQCPLLQPLEIDTKNRKIIVDDTIKRIIRYCNDGKVEMLRRKNDAFDWLPIHNDSLYTYQCLDEEGFVCDIRILFRASEDIEYQIYHEDFESIEKYNDILDKNASYSSSYFALTDDEKYILKIYDQLEPLTPILGRLEITIDNGYVICDFEEEDKKIINNLSDVYICVMEPDNAITREFVRRIPAHKQTISMVSFFMTYDDYFVWVEDKAGRIISAVSFLHLNEYDNDISVDFNNKLRLITLARYKKHLFPYIYNMYPAVNSSIMNAYNASEMNDNICTNNLYKYLILDGAYTTSLNYLPSQIAAVMEDLTIYGRYIADFFDKPIEIDYDQRKVYLPILANGMFIVEEYSRAGMITTYIKTAASEHILRPRLDAITVVSAIDFKTYKRSGFLLMNLVSTDSLQTYGYLIDTKRRDY